MQFGVYLVPDMALKLVTDVGGTQHGPVVYKGFVAPFSGAARLLPPPPNIQKCDQVAFSNSKPAQHAQRHHTVVCDDMRALELGGANSRHCHHNIMRADSWRPCPCHVGSDACTWQIQLSFLEPDRQESFEL